MRSTLELPAVKIASCTRGLPGFQLEHQAQQIDSLHELGFLKRAENRDHCSARPAWAPIWTRSASRRASESGRRVYRFTLAALIELADRGDRLRATCLRRLRVTHPLQARSWWSTRSAICRSATRSVAQIVTLLQVDQCTARARVTVLTSNKGFEEWGGVLGDEMPSWPQPSSTAILHHCTSSTSAATATG